jgi:hypothetical protein
MTHDGDPTDTSYERGTEVASDFMQSMDRLLGLLPTDDGPRRPKKLFYRVEWDSERPDKINDVVTMSAVATGARKEEFKGQFNQAQFRITETSDAGSAERFMWLRIGYRSPGTPIKIDPYTLYEDFNYLELTPSNIYFTMSDHVQTVPDYLRLASEMDGYEAEMPLGLRDQAVVLLRQFTKGGNIAANLDVGTLPAFAELLKGVGDSYASRLRHLLLSNLIDGLQYNDRLIAPDKAVAMLEVALREEILPTKPTLMERLLVCYPIYEQPFAIELLHATLQTQPAARWSTHIFGSDRTVFTQKFISTVLLSRTDDSNEVVVQESEEASALARFVQGVHNDQDLTLVGGALAQVLSQLRDVDPSVAADQEILDEKCKNIAEVLLRPVIDRKIGQQTLRATETDIDPS